MNTVIGALRTKYGSRLKLISVDDDVFNCIDNRWTFISLVKKRAKNRGVIIPKWVNRYFASFMSYNIEDYKDYDLGYPLEYFTEDKIK